MDEILFFGPASAHISNVHGMTIQAQFRHNTFFCRFSVTALIGAFLKACFRITDYPAPNPEPEILLGEKPALLFPIGWPIFSQVTCSR
jgi:hypothetical protein